MEGEESGEGNARKANKMFREKDPTPNDAEAS